MAKKPAKPQPKEESRQNRVWIEIEPHSDPEVCKERAALATRMIHRLNGHGEPRGYSFWWNERENRYCFGDPMGHKVLSDHGTWFNLDHFGRD